MAAVARHRLSDPRSVNNHPTSCERCARLGAGLVPVRRPDSRTETIGLALCRYCARDIELLDADAWVWLRERVAG